MNVSNSEFDDTVGEGVTAALRVSGLVIALNQKNIETDIHKQPAPKQYRPYKY